LASGYNKNMQKKKLLLLIGLIVLLVAAVFAWMHFFQRKSVNIINNEQETMINEQQLVDSEQQAESSNQELENSNQEPVISNQEPVTNAETKEESSSLKIVDEFISWGFQKSSGRKIDTIIIHSSYDALGDDPYSVSGILAEYKQYGVSAHYLIDRSGTIYHLVADKNIAYHAGVSKVPDGRTNVNNFSIGIEMINTQDGKFTNAQYDALNQLIKTLKKQYSIKYVLGHSDIAPGRKTDPWNINWGKVNK
jgi:N-acetyl-anhydromuramyl-L-alanine amidase AmpD